MARITCAGKTDVGLKRTNNEDNFIVVPSHGLYVLADGMGGHASGQVASAMCVSHVAQFICETSKQPGFDFPYKKNPALSYEANLLVNAIKYANERVFIQSCKDRAMEGMGTTVTAILNAPHGLVLAHVGDSRIYRVRQGQIVQMSRDHSLLNHLIDKGELKPEDAKNFPNKNVILRAVGLKDYVDVDVKEVPREQGDIYMMCSDGLSDIVSESLICQAITHNAPNLNECCNALIALALKAGGKDNVTTVCVCVEQEDGAPAQTNPMRSMVGLSGVTPQGGVNMNSSMMRAPSGPMARPQQTMGGQMPMSPMPMKSMTGMQPVAPPMGVYGQMPMSPMPMKSMTGMQAIPMNRMTSAPMPSAAAMPAVAPAKPMRQHSVRMVVDEPTVIRPSMPKPPVAKPSKPAEPKETTAEPREIVQLSEEDKSLRPDTELLLTEPPVASSCTSFEEEAENGATVVECPIISDEMLAKCNLQSTSSSSVGLTPEEEAELAAYDSADEDDDDDEKTMVSPKTAEFRAMMSDSTPSTPPVPPKSINVPSSYDKDPIFRGYVAPKEAITPPKDDFDDDDSIEIGLAPTRPPSRRW